MHECVYVRSLDSLPALCAIDCEKAARWTVLTETKGARRATVRTENILVMVVECRLERRSRLSWQESQLVMLMKLKANLEIGLAVMVKIAEERTAQALQAGETHPRLQARDE